MYYSPLRYPGGKGKISGFVKQVIFKNRLVGCRYIEPYAGGAGVALDLLMNKTVSRIVLNDISTNIYNFWDSVLHNSDLLCKRIIDTPITVDEWKRQSSILRSNASNDDIAFATFYLNRTNKSGIIGGGMIGGYSQEGKWKIDARYNKVNLVRRIENIAKLSDKIEIYNLDCLDLINIIVEDNDNTNFIYFDPPYFIQGKRLYDDYYTSDCHHKLSERISSLEMPWILTYDEVEEIEKYYSNNTILKYSLNYSVAKVKKGTELIIASNNIELPSADELLNSKTNFSYLCDT